MLLNNNRRRAAMSVVMLGLAMFLALLPVLPVFADPGDIVLTQDKLFIPQRGVTAFDDDGNEVGTGTLIGDVDLYPDGRSTGSATLDLLVGNDARTYDYVFDSVEGFGYDANGRLTRVTLSGELTTLVDGQRVTADITMTFSAEPNDPVAAMDNYACHDEPVCHRIPQITQPLYLCGDSANSANCDGPT